MLESMSVLFKFRGAAVRDLKEVHKHYVEELRFSSEQQVSRNNFYLVFQGVFIAGFLQALDKFTGDNIPIAIILCLFGCIFSMYQTRVAAANYKEINISSWRVKIIENILKSKDAERIDADSLDLSEKNITEKWIERDLTRSANKKEDYGRELVDNISEKIRGKESCTFDKYYFEKILIKYTGRHYHRSKQAIFVGVGFCFFWVSFFIIFFFRWECFLSLVYRLFRIYK